MLVIHNHRIAILIFNFSFSLDQNCNILFCIINLLLTLTSPKLYRKRHIFPVFLVPIFFLIFWIFPSILTVITHFFSMHSILPLLIRYIFHFFSKFWSLSNFSFLLNLLFFKIRILPSLFNYFPLFFLLTYRAHRQTAAAAITAAASKAGSISSSSSSSSPWPSFFTLKFQTTGSE